MKRRFFAFTLAEVLITLSIIGLVASMTIPTLINSYQEQVYLTKLKKAYSVWNQALTKLSLDYGCVGDLACTKLFAASTTHSSLGEALMPYFKVVKNCKAGTDTSCMAQAFKYYDGSHPDDKLIFNQNYYKFISADNISFAVWNYAHDHNASWTDCKPSQSRNATNHMTKICAGVWMDVNGLQPPNILGRDVFHFYITNGKGPLLYPQGGLDDGNYWKNTLRCTADNKWAYECAGRIIEEGWEMNY